MTNCKSGCMVEDDMCEAPRPIPMAKGRREVSIPKIEATGNNILVWLPDTDFGKPFGKSTDKNLSVDHGIVIDAGKSVQAQYPKIVLDPYGYLGSRIIFNPGSANYFSVSGHDNNFDADFQTSFAFITTYELIGIFHEKERYDLTSLFLNLTIEERIKDLVKQTIKQNN